MLPRLGMKLPSPKVIPTPKAECIVSWKSWVLICKESGNQSVRHQVTSLPRHLSTGIRNLAESRHEAHTAEGSFEHTPNEVNTQSNQNAAPYRPPMGCCSSDAMSGSCELGESIGETSYSTTDYLVLRARLERWSSISRRGDGTRRSTPTERATPDHCMSAALTVTEQRFGHRYEDSSKNPSAGSSSLSPTPIFAPFATHVFHQIAALPLEVLSKR